MAPIKQKWASKGWGFKIGGKMLTNLRFADDVLLIGNSVQQVTEMLNDLSSAAQKFGLEVHMGVIKILWNQVGEGRDEAAARRQSMCSAELWS